MLFVNALLALLPLTFAFSDPKVHERSRSRARSLHGGKVNALAKRQTYSGTATFYDVGLGACGGYNSAGDYIVAQNSAQYGGGYPGPNCGKSITISYNGRQVSATIADECPTCGYGSLDMSRGLFQALGGTEDMGTFQMTWWYNDGSSNQQKTTTTEQPKTTSTWVEPTSTYTPPTTTSTTPAYTPTTTSTQAPVSSAQSVAESITSSVAASITASSIAPGITTNGTVLPFVNTSTDPSATASATGSADDASASGVSSTEHPGNLVLFNQFVTYLGHIVVVGAGGA